MFDTFLPFLVIGITTGSVYGLAALGLVLTYQTTGIFNFAHGAVAAMAVFVFYYLHTEHGWPWPLAALVCLGVLAPVEGLLLERMTRAMARVAEVYKVVATVGLILIVVGVGNLWYGNISTLVPSFLPTGVFKVASVYIGWDQATVVVIAFVSAAGLYAFFRYGRLGIAMRAAVDSPQLLAMTGENTIAVQRFAWIIGTVFASMAGLLLAPELGLNGVVLTSLVVQAFGAAAIGRLASLPLTYVGGVIIGVGAALSTKYSNISWLAGLPSGLPFAVLFLVLVVTPRSKLAARRSQVVGLVHRSWNAPLHVRAVAWAIVIAVFALAPTFAGPKLNAYSITLIFVLMFSALGLVIRTSGQLLLCPLTFAAIGASAMSHFSVGAGLPWGVALVVAGLVAVPIGAFVAIPAIRLSGIFLALATFGLGVLVEKVFYTQSFMFGQTTAGVPVPRPHVHIGGWDLTTDSGFHYFLVIFVVAFTGLVLAIQSGRLGRLLRGLSDSPNALEVNGATTIVTKVIVLCIAAFLLSMGGALVGSLYTFESGADLTSFASLQMVVLVSIALVGDPWIAVVAAVGYRLIPTYFSSNFSNYLLIIFGVFAATFAMTLDHAPTVPGFARRFLERFGGRATESKADVPGSVNTGRAVVDASAARRAGATRPYLTVRDLGVRFGGVHAVDGFSMSAELGSITGLIGPNGAGKTTTLNACSGFVRPSGGLVEIDGTDLRRYGVAARARLGLGRTFQRGDLFDSLTVLENLIVAREAGLAGANPIAQVIGHRGDRDASHAAAFGAMQTTGITRFANVRAGVLSTGEKRLVELARVLTGSFDLLLLDEPSSGLHGAEVDRFGEVLVQVVAERGVGIVLVEHDMGLVRHVCDQVYVMDFGRLIFAGTVDEMLDSDAVRSAYLGSDAPHAVLRTDVARTLPGGGYG
ncbi:MAG: hypothetical protein QOG80_381 [Pseudonocardiales bacterium]|nr:hypothetical protein [Pseudonocardiales bacterium]